MRVTDRTIQSSFLYNLNDIKSRLSEKQVQITTGQKINKPSDDPSGTARLFRLNKQIEDLKTFQNNIDEGLSFVNNTILNLETIQAQSQDILTKLTEATNSAVAQADYAPKIEAAINIILDAANAKYADKYIFSGTDYSTKPYDWNAGGTAIETLSTGIDESRSIRISSTTTQKMNITGFELFGEVANPPGTDIFNRLIDIKTRLENGEMPTTSDIEAVDEFNTNVINKLSIAGNYYNRMQDMQTLLENQALDLNTLLAKEQEVDLSKAIMEMNNLQISMDRAIEVSSTILPKTLLDYL